MATKTWKSIMLKLLRWGVRRPQPMVVCVAFLCFFASCSTFVSTSGVNGAPYKFLGVKKVTDNADGTFLLEWDNIPKGTASYNVFKKEGTATDPQAAAATYDFTSPFIKVIENRYTTANVLLKYNACFVVRLIYPKYVDKNTKELCTNHTRFDFTGLNSAVAASDGVTLLWNSIPLSGMRYLIYETDTSGIYNYATPTQQVTDNNTYKSTPVSFGKTRCFLVRYYKEGAPADNNSKELCVGEGVLSGFSGIETVVSTSTGSAYITWKSAGSTAKNYRIYQGVDFSKLLDTVSGETIVDTIGTFTPGKTYDVGVRAVDAAGREDSNTKTISIKIADLNAPVFIGASQVDITGTRAIKVKWTAASPQPARYDIFVGKRDAFHADATLNCDLPKNATACRDIIDWTSVVASASSTDTEYTLSNMGDDQTVFIAVRAVSEAGTSDSNTVVKNLALPDAGAPVFGGITGAELVAGGKAKLTWSAPSGQVSYFYIYTTKSGITTTSTIAAMQSSDDTKVVQEYTTGVLLSTTTYSFKIAAKDRNGAVDTNTATRFVTTGDTQAPGAVSYMSASAQSETAMTLSFTSPVDSDVNKYEVHFEKCADTSGYSTSSPSCPSGIWGTSTLATVIPLTAYTPSSPISLLVTQLDARSVYRFNVRAVDSSSNPSADVAITKATLDTTAPEFAGVASAVQNPTEPLKVRVSWDSPSPIADTASYVIYRKKGSLSGITLNRNLYPNDVETNGITSHLVSSSSTLYSVIQTVIFGRVFPS